MTLSYLLEPSIAPQSGDFPPCVKNLLISQEVLFYQIITQFLLLDAVNPVDPEKDQILVREIFLRVFLPSVVPPLPHRFP